MTVSWSNGSGSVECMPRAIEASPDEAGVALSLDPAGRFLDAHLADLFGA